jgi:hypothetical protein
MSPLISVRKFHVLLYSCYCWSSKVATDYSNKVLPLTASQFNLLKLKNKDYLFGYPIIS